MDDVVDECQDPSIASAKLVWWRMEVARLYDGKPEHPVTQALQAVLPQFNLPQEQLLEIIDGMEMDLTQTRYLDFKGLSLYCYRVASVVGLLAAEIFGCTDRRTQKYAHDLGMAFQLTNIIRDVGEDARRGRIYLPIEDLQKFDVKASEILNAQYSDNFRRLMEFQIARAEQYYEQAFANLPAVDRRAQRPASSWPPSTAPCSTKSAATAAGPDAAHLADATAQAVARRQDLGSRGLSTWQLPRSRRDRRRRLGRACLCRRACRCRHPGDRLRICPTAWRTGPHRVRNRRPAAR